MSWRHLARRFGGNLHQRIQPARRKRHEVTVVCHQVPRHNLLQSQHECDDLRGRNHVTVAYHQEALLPELLVHLPLLFG
jgi:hypothetical protein